MWAKGSFSLFTFSHTNNNSFRPFSTELFQCLSPVCCRPVGTGHGRPSLSQTEIKTATQPPTKRKQQRRTAASPAPGCYKPRVCSLPKLCKALGLLTLRRMPHAPHGQSEPYSRLLAESIGTAGSSSPRSAPPPLPGATNTNPHSAQPSSAPFPELQQPHPRSLRLAFIGHSSAVQLTSSAAPGWGICCD